MLCIHCSAMSVLVTTVTDCGMSRSAVSVRVALRVCVGTYPVSSSVSAATLTRGNVASLAGGEETLSAPWGASAAPAVAPRESAATTPNAIGLAAERDRAARTIVIEVMEPDCD